MERVKFSPTEDIEKQIGYFFKKKELSAEYQQSLLSVGRVFGEDRKAIGTCFALDIDGSSFLVSAGHCFSDSKGAPEERKVKFPNGEIIQVKAKSLPLSNAFKYADIFICPMEFTQTPLLTVSAQEIDKNVETLVLGYPDAYLRKRRFSEPVCSIGKIVDIRKINESRVDFCTNARTEPGNSGSPWLDLEGKVFGVSFMRQYIPRYFSAFDHFKADAYNRSGDARAISVLSLSDIISKI